MITLQNKKNQTLLSLLKGFYTQLSHLSLDITQSRIKFFQRHSKPPLKIDITTILNKQVDDLAAHVVTKPVEDMDISDENSENQPLINHSDDKIPRSNYSETITENVDSVDSDFAKYLKQRKTGAITQPQMGENLKSSAWEHVHCAIRHAKNGAVDTAKLHASIAGTALEEAGNYMNNEEYSQLLFDIEKYFLDNSTKK